MASEESPAFALLEKGRELIEQGNHVQAVSLLEKAVSVEPGKGSILEALGTAYYACRMYGEAAGSFEKALEVDPTNDFARYCLGLCYLKLERTVEAGGQFKLAWSLRPVEQYREMSLRFSGERGGGTQRRPG